MNLKSRFSDLQQRDSEPAPAQRDLPQALRQAGTLHRPQGFQAGEGAPSLSLCLSLSRLLISLPLCGIFTQPKALNPARELSISRSLYIFLSFTLSVAL